MLSLILCFWLIVRSLADAEHFWHCNSEHSTRTLIDFMLLDTLRQMNAKKPDQVCKMSTWTDISLSWSKDTDELSGRGDYLPDTVRMLILRKHYRHWEFVRVGNDGVVVTSGSIVEQADVLTWLGYLITNDRASTPYSKSRSVPPKS